MKAYRALPLLLIALPNPALATSTLCAFEAVKGDLYYAFRFFGYDDVPGIIIDEPAGLRIQDYKGYRVLEFDTRASKIHLVYDSSGGDGVIPSFTLKGAGKNVRMTVAGHELTGYLSCSTY